jgi:hypothetical protein
MLNITSEHVRVQVEDFGRLPFWAMIDLTYNPIDYLHLGTYTKHI